MRAWQRPNGWWCASVSKHTIYAIRREKGPDGLRHPIMLHRFILDAPPGKDVDHIDGDGLNNARANLRLTSRAINASNRKHGKPVQGTFFDKASKKWRVQIVTGGVTLEVGRFETESDATEAYREAAKRWHAA